VVRVDSFTSTKSPAAKPEFSGPHEALPLGRERKGGNKNETINFCLGNRVPQSDTELSSWNVARETAETAVPESDGRRTYIRISVDSRELLRSLRNSTVQYDMSGGHTESYEYPAL
jgi:hypothetical protein